MRGDEPREACVALLQRKKRASRGRSERLDRRVVTLAPGRPADAEIEAVLRDDPFVRVGIAEYEILEFVPTRFSRGLCRRADGRESGDVCACAPLYSGMFPCLRLGRVDALVRQHLERPSRSRRASARASITSST